MKENTSKIDHSMRVVGEIVTDGMLILEGELQGSFIGRKLIVGKSGYLVGTVKGEAVECAGHLEGNVVTKSLTLKKGGCQIGTAVTDKLEVEAGAVLDCALQSGTVDSAALLFAKRVEKEVKGLELSRYVDAFKENNRPCCFDVPGSSRLELYKHIGLLLKEGKPLIRVVGERGSGKTVLAQKLIAASFENHLLLQLEQKVGSVTTLLKEVAARLGLAGYAKGTDKKVIIAEIRQELEKRSEAGERVVLLIDDAQEMFQATMEGVIQLLSGACGEQEISRKKSLQLILLGTGEMKSKMVATILAYFEDETNCRLSLKPLTMRDTADYLRLGLQRASSRDESAAMVLMPAETIKEIHVCSKGSVAVVNRIMDNALEQAHHSNDKRLTPALVQRVVCTL